FVALYRTECSWLFPDAMVGGEACVEHVSVLCLRSRARDSWKRAFCGPRGLDDSFITGTLSVSGKMAYTCAVQKIKERKYRTCLILILHKKKKMNCKLSRLGK